jgi:hypothetical protein
VTTFSQRQGIKPVSEILQVGGMNADLRNSLWNVLDAHIWSTDRFVWTQRGAAGIEKFSRDLWFHFFKLPVDSRPARNDEILRAIRKRFFECAWNEVYDFIEFVLRIWKSPVALSDINFILERELAGYRVVENQFVPITDAQEVAMLQSALADNRFAGVSAHLKQALEHLSNRENPDYRNSIKESISAVEGMACIVAEMPKASLGDALKALERRGKLHPALKDGFSKLYGYTSDADGIRHAMLEEPNLSVTDAKFFLLSCTSFVNYLKTQL